jgi:signal transduction histidine kinase
MTDNHNSSNILVVDDAHEVAAHIALILNKGGYSTTIATEGTEALSIARDTPPALVLVGLTMPGLDRYEVCQQIHNDERLKDVPVILMSAAHRADLFEKALQAGASDFMALPVQDGELLARVERQLQIARLRRENQSLRERDHARVLELNRMKDRFVRGMSHDLKNAIGIVLGYAEMLVEESSSANSQVQYYAGRIQRGAKQLISLVNSLVDLARIEESILFNLEPVSLPAALQVCLEEARLQVAGKQIELVIAPIPEVTFLMDAARLSQAVGNLLSNAIKFTPAGGRVEFRAQVEGDQLVIKVTDTGLGIPPDAIPQLFKKFYRVNQREHINQEGAGLGLYITRTIIERHNGRVSAESQPGSGSVFTITLPVTG